MKKIVLLLPLFAFLFSCSAPKKISEVKSLYTIDFTKYSEEGFLFTPYQYNGEYESIASIRFEYSPDATRVSANQTREELKAQAGTKFSIRSDGQRLWRVRDLNMNNVLDDIYKYAKSKGADAIVDFKIESRKLKIGTLSIDGIVITGFAIKRK